MRKVGIFNYIPVKLIDNEVKFNSSESRKLKTLCFLSFPTTCLQIWQCVILSKLTTKKFPLLKTSLYISYSWLLFIPNQHFDCRYKTNWFYLCVANLYRYWWSCQNMHFKFGDYNFNEDLTPLKCFDWVWTWPCMQILILSRNRWTGKIYSHTSEFIYDYINYSNYLNII